MSVDDSGFWGVSTVVLGGSEDELGAGVVEVTGAGVVVVVLVVLGVVVGASVVEVEIVELGVDEVMGADVVDVVLVVLELEVVLGAEVVDVVLVVLVELVVGEVLGSAVVEVVEVVEGVDGAGFVEEAAEEVATELAVELSVVGEADDCTGVVVEAGVLVVLADDGIVDAGLGVVVDGTVDGTVDAGGTDDVAIGGTDEEDADVSVSFPVCSGVVVTFNGTAV